MSLNVIRMFIYCINLIYKENSTYGKARHTGSHQQKIVSQRINSCAAKLTFPFLLSVDMGDSAGIREFKEDRKTRNIKARESRKSKYKRKEKYKIKDWTFADKWEIEGKERGRFSDLCSFSTTFTCNIFNFRTLYSP